VLDIPRDTPFEGEGDALFSVEGSRLWVANGPRSVAGSHQHLAATWGVEVTSLDLVDPRFYHLDTCFAPLSDGSILYYPAAFGPRSLAAIEAFYPPEDRIVVTEADAVRFACNAVNVGNTIILNQISAGLTAALESRGFEVIQVNLSEFLKAGGAAKCLVMKLSHEAKPILGTRELSRSLNEKYS
jgi:arginine dihydrolase